ncbi:MAG: SurA N-terminal domain-containing protein [Rhodocyclaceae bacterium]|nr:SurA N-terminal domain-containing protein [Rhodocyclaceae bacterium]
MFDLVRSNRRMMQVILALIILPFAFWGVESYVRNVGAENDAAVVGGSKISPQEFQAALRDQQEKMRPMLGAGADPAALDSREVREAVLESLVNQRLLALHAVKTHMTVSDAHLVDYIRSVPGLQENGQFSKERYEALVANQGMSKEMFEARLRQDLAVQEMVAPIAGAGLGSASATVWVAAQLQERTIAEAQIKPEQFTGEVKLPADAARTYYDGHQKEFETREQVKAEFVVLSQAVLSEQVAVSDDEVKARYQAQQDRYTRNEERRASHILVLAAKGAPDAEKAAAKAKAEDILAQVRKAPGDFAKLAQQHSQDPGSAKQGGDLQWFPRDGRMVKPFEDAVFGLKENQISDLVVTDYGFHIIRVTGIRPGGTRPLEQVKAEIAAELKGQAAAKKYAESADALTNTVYEQSDSLKPAADKLKLAIRQSEWLPRGGTLPPPFNHPKLQSALFSDDVLKNKRNTEAVEVSPNTLVAARVVEHRPGALRPFEEVRADIERKLARDEAAKLAAAKGRDLLARLEKGEGTELRWGETRKVTRVQAPMLAPEAVKAIFSAPAGKLPAYVGTALPSGAFGLYRVSAVAEAGAPAQTAANAMRQQYARTAAEEEFNGWLAGLRERYGVKVNKAVLDAKDR